MRAFRTIIGGSILLGAPACVAVCALGGLTACSSNVAVATTQDTSSTARSDPASDGAGGEIPFEPATDGGTPVGCNDGCGAVFGAEGGGGCVGCAIAGGACEDLHLGCLAEPQCAHYESCLDACADDSACSGACLDTHPLGAAAYEPLYYCLMCSAGPFSCVGTCLYSCTIP